MTSFVSIDEHNTQLITPYRHQAIQKKRKGIRTKKKIGEGKKYQYIHSAASTEQKNICKITILIYKLVNVK